jgi:hypothetical protein
MGSERPRASSPVTRIAFGAADPGRATGRRDRGRELSLHHSGFSGLDQARRLRSLGGPTMPCHWSSWVTGAGSVPTLSARGHVSCAGPDQPFVARRSASSGSSSGRRSASTTAILSGPRRRKAEPASPTSMRDVPFCGPRAASLHCGRCEPPKISRRSKVLPDASSCAWSRRREAGVGAASAKPASEAVSPMR